MGRFKSARAWISMGVGVSRVILIARNCKKLWRDWASTSSSTGFAGTEAVLQYDIDIISIAH